MLVSTTFGNETFNNSSAKYYIFVCRTEAFPLINPIQQHLWQAAKSGRHAISRHGDLNISDAAPGCGDLLGKWTTASYNLSDGLVLKIFGQLKPEDYTGRPTFGNIFLQVRESGPLVSITGNLTGNEKAQRSSISIFEGRADILTFEEIIDLGIRQDTYTFMSSDGSALFEVKEISAAKGERPEVVEKEIKNTSGEKAIIKTTVRKRAIQF